MRTPLALCCAALVTGCTAAPGGSTSRADAGAAALELSQCTNVGAVFPVPLESARAALPPGFEPLVSSGDPAGGAVLYVLGLRCQDAVVNGVSHGESLLAYAELAVTPPADFALPDISDYTVPLLFTATPAAVGDALAAQQLGQAGSGELSWEDLTPAGGGLVVRARFGGASLTLTAALAPTPPATLGSGGFALFGVQQGSVRSTLLGHAEGGSSVQGAVTLQASGGPAPLQEARQAARGFSVSGFSLRFTPLP